MAPRPRAREELKPAHFLHRSLRAASKAASAAVSNLLVKTGLRHAQHQDQAGCLKGKSEEEDGKPVLRPRIVSESSRGSARLKKLSSLKAKVVKRISWAPLPPKHHAERMPRRRLRSDQEGYAMKTAGHRSLVSSIRRGSATDENGNNLKRELALFSDEEDSDDASTPEKTTETVEPNAKGGDSYRSSSCRRQSVIAALRSRQQQMEKENTASISPTSLDDEKADTDCEDEGIRGVRAEEISLPRRAGPPPAPTKPHRIEPIESEASPKKEDVIEKDTSLNLFSSTAKTPVKVEKKALLLSPPSRNRKPRKAVDDASKLTPAVPGLAPCPTPKEAAVQKKNPPKKAAAQEKKPVVMTEEMRKKKRRLANRKRREAKKAADLENERRKQQLEKDAIAARYWRVTDELAWWERREHCNDEVLMAWSDIHGVRRHFGIEVAAASGAEGTDGISSEMRLHPGSSSVYLCRAVDVMAPSVTGVTEVIHRMERAASPLREGAEEDDESSQWNTVVPSHILCEGELLCL